MQSPQETLARLQDGNRRFVSECPAPVTLSRAARRRELLTGQEPCAIILGCSDSRVPPDIVFDQGLGDLFVVRVAGNTAGSSQVNSIEFAVEKLGTRLVVVLGHSNCGAVLAALEDLKLPLRRRSPSLAPIVASFEESLVLPETERRQDSDSLVCHAVRENIRMVVNQLRSESKILERRVQRDGLLIVGAGYSLETGVVDFFDSVAGPIAAEVTSPGYS